MAQVYTVTASTSIVLVNSIVAPNTVVLLSSIQYPGHIIGVRDTTGSSQITQYPVIVSTMAGLKFYDGTSSVLINQPNGYLSFSSRDPSTWQLLNSFGFLTTLSTGFVETLTTQRAFATTISTVEAFMSSMTVANVFISKSFEVLGNTDIEGDIAIGGSLNIFSSLHAFQSMNLSSALTVGENVIFTSSLSIQDEFTVGSNLSTFQNLFVGDSLTIDKSLYTTRVFLPSSLSVQTLTVNTLDIFGGLQTAGGVSTNLICSFSSFTVLGKGTFEDGANIFSTTAIVSSLTVGFINAYSTIAKGDVAVFQNVETSSFTVRGGFSTLQTATFGGPVEIKDGLSYGPIYVSERTTLENLTGFGTAFLSSLRVSTLNSMGFLSSYGSTFTVIKDLNIRSTFVIGNDLIAGFRGEPLTFASFSTASFLSSLAVQSNLILSTSLTVGEDAWVRGNMESIRQLTVGSNVSTNFLTVIGSVTVSGDTDIDKALITTTFGAPIRLNLSTLVLSNTLTVGDASIPSLETDDFTGNIAVGINLTAVGSCNLYVDGILQNRDTVTQTVDVNPLKLWRANSLRASTIQGYSNVSTAVIGPTTFQYPIGNPSLGILTGGIPSLSNIETIYFKNNISTQSFAARPLSSLTAFHPRKIRYNGSNRWVAVGQRANMFGINAMYSSDGYNWTSVSGIGPGNVLIDVVYGNGRWVVAGSNSAGSSNLFYSSDGINWATGSNTFSPSGYATGIAYNQPLWVAVGSQGGAIAAKYSFDGVFWVPGNVSPSISQPFTSVVWAGTSWCAYTKPQLSGTSVLYQSLNGVSWTQVGGTSAVNVDSMWYGTAPPGFSNSDVFVCVGSNKSFSPLTTISYGNSLGLPVNLQPVGVFTAAATDIAYDSNNTSWYVSGYDVGGFGPNLAFSKNLSNWFPLLAFIGSNLTVATGTIEVPNVAPYFTANMTSIFHSTLSSQSIVASTVNASSFQGNFSGDGSLLTNIEFFSENLLTSFVKVSTIRTTNISSGISIMNMTSTMDTVTVNKTSFFSSGNIFLAAGNDYIANGSIQTSQNGSTWSQALTSSFNTYGNAITGTSNLDNPLYFAAGADTRENYTIQYSTDGFGWNPIESGGFTYATEEGIHEAKDIAYDSVTDTWVAVGVDIGGVSTIQYSDDILNWNDVTNGFLNFGLKVVASPYAGSATRFLAIGSEGMKRSSDGETWVNNTIQLSVSGIFSNITTTFTAIAPGKISFFLATNGWIAVDTQNRVFIADSNGTTFTHYTNQSPPHTTQSPVNDLLWLGQNQTNWVAIGCNALQTSTDGVYFYVSQGFNVVSLNKIVYNANLNRYVMAATASNQDSTFFTSSNTPYNWSPAAPNSGFSTTVANYGQGYGVVSLGISTFAVGNSALSVQGRVRPSILSLSYTPEGTYITEVSLTASNASNLFTTAVRGIGASSNEINQYVVVGDAGIPQKTIARSPDGTPNSWIPAITGGFSTTGYGVTYFNSNWIAVGDAQTTGNIIQYSPDGANWFGTNNAPGIRRGGRGIAAKTGLTGITGGNLAVAVGNDTTTSTIVYSYDGFDWNVASSGYFNVQGNGVAIGSNTAGNARIVAVGQDSRSASNSILVSNNGIAWSNLSGNFFQNEGGFGVAYGNVNFVAVGDRNQNGVTIFYSDGNAVNFYESANSFTATGYGVTFNTAYNLFFAVGKDSNGDSPLTVKYSGDGQTWSNFSTGFGFVSQKELGSANGLFTQPIAATETLPYINFCNLVIYDRETPLLYPYPTIRVSTKSISLTEGVFVQSSLQVRVGVDEAFDSSALSVSPFATFASRVIYTGQPYISSFAIFSTIQVSTVETGVTGQVFQTLNPITTPSLALNVPSTTKSFVDSFEDEPSKLLHTKANNIYPLLGRDGAGSLTYSLFINDALQVTNYLDTFFVYTILNIGQLPLTGILSTFGGYGVNINGTFATSTLSTIYYYEQSTLHVSTSGIYFKDQFLTLFEGQTKPSGNEGFTIQTTPSSITFENLLTLQVSTQKVGVFTSNPNFSLDVQRLAVTQEPIQTKRMNTSLLSFQFQTF